MVRMAKHALRTVAVVSMLVGLATPLALAEPKSTTPSASTETTPTEDVIILDSGREVRGQIIEESTTHIIMDVEFRGIKTRTTYQKSEVLELHRDRPVAAAAPTAPVADDDDAEAKEEDDESDEPKARPEWVNDDTSLLYIAELKGVLGFDITPTPFEELFKDVDRQFDDLVDVPGSAGEKQVRADKRDKNIVVLKLDCQTNPQAGFDGLFTAEHLLPIIKKERAKGRRIVMWVDNAGGGAAFLAMMSPEIYMMREGWMGGIGTLDDFDIGDKLVNEKQISLRLGHAEGVALYGGYGEVGVTIVRAMTRKQFWFAARLVGGQPEVILENPLDNPDLHGAGWTILSDDGEGDNKDDPDALKGNDVLMLEADWAQKLGVSKGVADTVDELAFALRIDRNFYELPETRAEKVLEGWKEEIENVVDQVHPGNDNRPPGELWKKFNDVPKHATSTAQAIGQQIRILKQIHSLVGRYAEVLDREAQWRGQLEVQIEELKQTADRDRRSQQDQNRRQQQGGPRPQ